MTIHEGSEKLAKALLLPINPALIVVLGIYTAVWGGWLLFPFSDVFSRAKLYSVMAHIAPEWAWGCFAIFCGALIIYGAVQRSYWPLVRGAMAGAFHWFLIALCYFLGDFASTGGITSLTFAAYAALVGLNIKINFKHDTKSTEILH